MTVKKPRIKRYSAGLYYVADRWRVAKDDDTGAWEVIRFKSTGSYEVEQKYTFDTYAEARDHALMEANIAWLGETL